LVIVLAVVVALGVAASLAVVLVGGSTSRKPQFRGDHLPPGVAGRPAPAFNLRDARGGMLNTAALAGKPYAVTFLYTKCKDVCPLIGDELRQALRLLGSQSRQVNVVAVSVDPRTDNLSSVQAWLAKHHEPANFHYVIGSDSQLKPVWNGYYVGPQPAGSTESRHSANIWLIDRKGRWRTKFSAGFPVNPSDIAHDMRLLIGEPGPKSP
jgi:protein SCO1/2